MRGLKGERMERKFGVAGIIPRGRTVLRLRRAHTDGFLPGAYDLPGGWLEPGESPEDGIRREVMEETGLRTLVVRNLGEGSYLRGSGAGDKTLIVYLLRPAGDGFRITLSQEYDEYRWVEDSDLGKVFGQGDLMRDVIH